jgi:amino acid transporter
VSLLDWTYVSLAVTSAAGAFLFFGYGWLGPLLGRSERSRQKPLPLRRRGIPINWVLVHIVLASATLILFSDVMFTVRPPHAGFLVAAYVFYVLTFFTGLGFFLRFDRRRRRLKPRLLGLHLLMAVITFTLITSAMALYAYTPPPPARVPPSASSMRFFYRQHMSELKRFEQTHHGQSTLWWMTGQAPPKIPGLP